MLFLGSVNQKWLSDFLQESDVKLFRLHLPKVPKRFILKKTQKTDNICVLGTFVLDKDVQRENDRGTISDNLSSRRKTGTPLLIRNSTNN